MMLLECYLSFRSIEVRKCDLEVDMEGTDTPKGRGFILEDEF